MLYFKNLSVLLSDITTCNVYVRNTNPKKVFLAFLDGLDGWCCKKISTTLTVRTLWRKIAMPSYHRHQLIVWIFNGLGWWSFKALSRRAFRFNCMFSYKTSKVRPRYWWYLKLVISVYGDLTLFIDVSKLMIFYVVLILVISDFVGDALITNFEVLLYLHIFVFVDGVLPDLLWSVTSTTKGSKMSSLKPWAWVQQLFWSKVCID